MSRSSDVERWKGALITRPDQQFFEVIRFALGKIETPFNKHQLLEDLIAYLKSRETRERILSLISPGDAFLLTAIFALNKPDLPTLYDFLKGTVPYLDLHNHLLNLEERMLIYKSIEDGAEVMRPNPLLADDLETSVVDPHVVFESTSAMQGAGPWVCDRLILSVVAFIREHPAPFKAGRKFKSKIVKEAAARFSFADTKEATGRLILMVLALESAGIIRQADGEFDVAHRELADFASLSQTDRLACLAGGLAASDWTADNPESGAAADQQQTQAYPGLSAFEYACAAKFLLERADPSRSYPAFSLGRMLIAGGLSLSVERHLIKLLNAMKALGLLGSEGGSYRPSPLPVTTGNGIEAPAAVLQPNFEITLTEQASFARTVTVALGARLVSYDVCPVFELTRETVTKRFADGVSAAQLINSLEMLSAVEPPSNVVFSLKSWEKEFLSVRIFHGSVLLVDENRRHLVEHNPDMKKLIISIPAPGVYLMRAGDQAKIEKTLHGCGINQKPALEGSGSLEGKGETDAGKRFQDLDFLAPPAAMLHRRKKKPRPKPGIDVPAELNRKLDTMDVTAEMREELARMIRQRLLLYPEQLEYHAASPREKNEAKGFDYVGKVRIIEQALSRQGTLLEIMTRGTGGKSVRYLVAPAELSKGGADLTLLCRELPNLSTLKLRVRSMSHVRSVRGSLFATS
ncbi:MAG: hypothetical protein JW852_03135 [Spirochaetales bacterium]|nr:hypothetical protein [Spirochaetales bacterium]